VSGRKPEFPARIETPLVLPFFNTPPSCRSSSAAAYRLGMVREAQPIAFTAGGLAPATLQRCSASRAVGKVSSASWRPCHGADADFRAAEQLDLDWRDSTRSRRRTPAGLNRRAGSIRGADPFTAAGGGGARPSATLREA
jgi:hypothetical protein